MIRPRKLQVGDTVATISLSWGGAGALPHRYQAGKRQLAETFGVRVVETRHALKPADWIYRHPEARAQDLMEAFADPNIKAIISNIGGDDSIRTLPFVDPAVIRANPKIFLGFSDTTVTHLCCYQAGLTSFYGTSILVGFAENGGMHEYQIRDLRKTLFQAEPIGQIHPNPQGWTSERLEWANPENQPIHRTLQPASGWRWLQGSGLHQGHLLGGCVEVLDFLKGTPILPSLEQWKGAIAFFETSEEQMPPHLFLRFLRSLVAMGVLAELRGIILGRPHDDEHWQAYDQALIQIVREEEGLSELPIVTGMDFGHTCPTFTLPYGVQAQLDCEQRTFSLVESGVSA
ncbi:MAG: S66 peptidase family protein [Bacteroidota bacterium]